MADGVARRRSARADHDSPAAGGLSTRRAGFSTGARPGARARVDTRGGRVYTDRLCLRYAARRARSAGRRNGIGGIDETDGPGTLTEEEREGGTDTPRGERFPSGARLRSGDEIGAVLREGERRRSGSLEIFWRASPARRPRVGFVVPRHGRSIADRNRVKRQLREIARRDWLPGALAEGAAADVVVRARPGAYETEFDELRRSLVSGLEAAACDGCSSP